MEIKWNCFAPRTRRLVRQDSSSTNFILLQFRILSILIEDYFTIRKKKRERPRIKTDSKNVPPSPPFPPSPFRICKLGRKADETRNPLTYAWLYTQGTRRNSGDSSVLRGGEAVVFLALKSALNSGGGW